MAIDPSDPGTFEDDETGKDREIDVEAPENDAAEQYTDLAPDRDDPLEDVDPARANEADIVEQHRVVSIDEDDYR
ncbi:hypothetical protein ACFY1L_10490 [Streptomyces sp. NPDC001663]|uniref:hypothetical protein n=1 Tax=Streptomyces sp. NPDC001663 TaxID=3364597 RepID=UPI00369AC3C2